MHFYCILEIFLLHFLNRFGTCSGYADRIHELMIISRDLGGRNASSIQSNGSGNYVTEANYIEFDGVKVINNLSVLILPPSVFGF